VQSRKEALARGSQNKNYSSASQQSIYNKQEAQPVDTSHVSTRA